MKYKIYAALAEEENEGWVWFKSPSMPTRTLIKLHRPKSGQTIFCQARQIDKNFLGRYNESKHTCKIQSADEERSLVIGEWYRDALGGFETQSEVDLDISPLTLPLWRDVRVACNHPDMVARIGTRLGILGTWLGLIGITPLFLELLDVDKCAKLIIEVAVLAIITVLSIAACRGVRSRPHS